jgi:hypothetical protein
VVANADLPARLQEPLRALFEHNGAGVPHTVRTEDVTGRGDFILEREKTMNATSDKPQAAEGRDLEGRFAAGNKCGPGNPFARKVAQLRTALVNFVTEEDMKHLAFVLKMRAEGGDMQAMKLLFQYVLGKPAATVDPDRLDVDEWQKMQEKSRPPEEATKVLAGLPAQTVCEVTNVAWPCAVDQTFNQPILTGLREMDERDAKRAANPQRQARADDGPMPNGPNGAEDEPFWWRELQRVAREERAARKSAEKSDGRPSTNGNRRGKSGH